MISVVSDINIYHLNKMYLFGRCRFESPYKTQISTVGCGSRDRYPPVSWPDTLACSMRRCIPNVGSPCKACSLRTGHGLERKTHCQT